MYVDAFVCVNFLCTHVYVCMSMHVYILFMYLSVFCGCTSGVCFFFGGGISVLNFQIAFCGGKKEMKSQKSPRENNQSEEREICGRVGKTVNYNCFRGNTWLVQLNTRAMTRWKDSTKRMTKRERGGERGKERERRERGERKGEREGGREGEREVGRERECVYGSTSWENDYIMHKSYCFIEIEFVPLNFKKK